MAEKLLQTTKTDKKLNSLSAQTKRMKEVLIEELTKCPIIQVSCQRAGIGRSTFYKWRKEDKNFAELADIALTEGKKFTNDMAESQLIKAIGNGNITSIIYWLKNNHPDYADKIRYEYRHEYKVKSELTEEESESISAALCHIGLANILKKEGVTFTEKELAEAERIVTAYRLREGYYKEEEKYKQRLEKSYGTLDRNNTAEKTEKKEEQSIPPPAIVKHGKPPVKIADVLARRRKEEEARLKILGR